MSVSESKAALYFRSQYSTAHSILDQCRPFQMTDIQPQQLYNSNVLVTPTILSQHLHGTNKGISPAWSKHTV